MLQIGRRWLIPVPAFAFDGAKSVLAIYTAARYPLLVEAYSIGNGSAATSAQVRTVWSLETGGPSSGGTGITPIALDAVVGGSPQFTAKYGTGSGTFDDTANQENKAWASVYGLEHNPASPRSWLWLPAGSGPNTWHLRLLNTPTTTFNADVQVIVQEIPA